MTSENEFINFIDKLVNNKSDEEYIEIEYIPPNEPIKGLLLSVFVPCLDCKWAYFFVPVDSKFYEISKKVNNMIMGENHFDFDQETGVFCAELLFSINNPNEANEMYYECLLIGDKNGYINLLPHIRITEISTIAFL